MAKVNDEAIVIVCGDELLEAGGELIHGLPGRWIDGVELQVESVRGGDVGEGDVFRPRVCEGLLTTGGDGIRPALHEGMQIAAVDDGFERDGGGVAVLTERVGGLVG